MCYKFKNTFIVIVRLTRRRMRKCLIPVKKAWSCFVLTPGRSWPTVFASSGEDSRATLKDWTAKVFFMQHTVIVWSWYMGSFLPPFFVPFNVVKQISVTEQGTMKKESQSYWSLLTIYTEATGLITGSILHETVIWPILSVKTLYLKQQLIHKLKNFSMTHQTGSLLPVKIDTWKLNVDNCKILIFCGFFCSASLARMGESKNTDAVSKETHEEEMDRLKLEIQQCKDFIQTQQQLLQVRVKLS